MTELKSDCCGAKILYYGQAKFNKNGELIKIIPMIECTKCHRSYKPQRKKGK